MHPDFAFKIAITTGEPAGVGPELTALALARALLTESPAWPDAHFTVLGDTALLEARAKAVGVDWLALLATGYLTVRHEGLAAPSRAGQLNAKNSHYVLALLDAAIDGALAESFDAIVTAPLQKSVINEVGIPFTGHTEYLAARTGTAQVVMMLAGSRNARTESAVLATPTPTSAAVEKIARLPKISRVLGHDFRVALATTHMPLKEVAAALTIDKLMATLGIIDSNLRRDFGIRQPRILVTGLNPHAGEQGHLGHEEIEVIIPALEQAQALGIDARGPYPADTLFQPRYLDQADCVLAMYHDQGLPVLKYATFGTGINVTLGLPIIRTSVDHGTALDLAGTGQADPASLLEAIDAAVVMARHRRFTQLNLVSSI
ncbi:4-hydroxythreonine-4-phosphate dehydrogenase PdxA [Mycoavidus sp. SF9855]|uniref:4-hydroxythreonine-4-phosphate dehydrogenase PdxA n=1 Tax=Mycoavidus sp. SF9855 TaxID=2968475 RepID=UPI00211C1DBD|nr:4-hydroxythreonine-4-phosphate dehydrogenase PdxA [Mycoavidus sp. SF9855]UUM21923.1 4-hydroxythreonine-4-phosphate dehydrogenase PdxA [Mycoavidus sp. SF9855]